MEMNLIELLNPIIADEYKLAIEEIIKTQNITTNAELILQLCKIITKEIEIIQLPQHSEKGQIYKNIKNISSKAESKLMVYGAQLIYLLRTFIHGGEEIIFHMSSKDAQGKYKASAFIPQSEILTNLSKVKKEAIGVAEVVSNNLINQYQNHQQFQIKRKNMWILVENLAQFKYKNSKVNKIDMRKSNEKKAHWAYQNQKKDYAIYAKYNYNKKYHYNQIIKYYDMKDNGSKDSLMYFNDGWLWQWYNKILYGGLENEHNNVIDSLNAGSLRPIMSKADNVPGTKEGDFQDLQNRQIQSKYANLKIISYNNIRHVIYDLEKALTQYLAESENAVQNLINILNEHFFPDSAQIGGLYAADIIEKLLQENFDKEKKILYNINTK